MTQQVETQVDGAHIVPGSEACPPKDFWSSPRRRSLITLFCLFHMGMVVVFNLPQNTGLGNLRAQFAWYGRLSWLHQEWGMFTTIPHYAALSPVLVAKYDDGHESTHGPLLPGLAPYSGDLRALYLVLHTLWPAGEYAPLAHGYLNRACTAIAAQVGEKPASVMLRVDAQVLTSLTRVRVSGRPARAARQSSKALKCR